jgi:polysaccharide chain length determinant protein (PEP-CTERM system associated)
MPYELEEDPSEKQDWRKYWSLLRRRRWWLALPAFAVFVVVWISAWLVPAVYRSETLILVEQQKVPEQYIVSNVASDLQERLQSMTQQILSRTRLIRIIEELSLYERLRSGRSLDEVVEVMRKDIQIDLVQAPNRRDLTAFKIAYLARDPHKAQEVTDRLSSLFIEENLKVRQQQAENTTEFLDSQLADSRNNLARQEERVKEFKSRYLGELPGQVESNVQILSGLQMRLQQEMDALANAKQRSVYYESLLGQYRTMQSDLQQGRDALSAQTPPALDQELARLRSQLADLSSHYTERHPDIRKLKEQIAKTEKMKEQIDAKLAAARADGSDTSSNAVGGFSGSQTISPAVEVQSQLKANAVEIENREKSIQQIQRQIEGYQARLNTTPVREQQLADLTRDYDQSRKNYESLLAKRDQSEMATNLEKRQQGEQFRVLDPPNLPQKPYSPNRFKLNLIGLVAGLLLGFVSLAGSDMLDERIYSKEELQKIVTAPVLSEIPPLLTIMEDYQESRMQRVQLIVLTLLVVLTAAGVGVTYLIG